jgi:hypothetical protein
MGGTRRGQIAGPVGLCFLGLLFLRLSWLSPGDSPGAKLTHPYGVRPLRGPADQALREARLWHLRAMQEVSARFDALEAWDPEAPAGRDPVAWRQMMAQDAHGLLRRAREEAGRSLGLARSPQEVYQAALMLARMECEAGDHKAELLRARQVMALQPQNPLSLITLHRAAECNRLRALARETNRKLKLRLLGMEPVWQCARRAAESCGAGQQGSGDAGTDGCATATVEEAAFE